MSAVFYQKYKNLFFEDQEPISLNYFISKPKNALNVYPGQNIASMAQHFNILPKDIEMPRAKIEEIPRVRMEERSRLEEIPRMKEEIFRTRPEEISISSQVKTQAPQRLEPLNYKPMSLKNLDEKPKVRALDYFQEPQGVNKESPKRAPSLQRLPPISYESTKGNIFPEKTEAVRTGNPMQETLKRRKDAKAKISDRRQRLKELLASDQ